MECFLGISIIADSGATIKPCWQVKVVTYSVTVRHQRHARCNDGEIRSHVA